MGVAVKIVEHFGLIDMKTHTIYLTVRVDIDCPDDYDCSRLSDSDVFVNCISLNECHPCEINDFEICRIIDG